jgi:hypothetical protein
MGSELRSGWSISAPDNLGVYDTAHWVPTQWLSQLGMAWAEDTGGLAAVLAIAAVLQVATLAVVYLTCREHTSPLAAAVACMVCFMALAAAFTPRPQVASYLLFAVSVAAWRRATRSGQAPLGLILLTWLWVPVHGMWPIAVVLGLVMATGLSLDRVVEGRQRLLVFAVPVVSVLLAAATPLGVTIFEGVLEVGGRRMYFAEWAAPDFTDVRAVAVLVMAAVVLVAVLRDGPLQWTPVLYLGVAIGLAVFSFRTLPLAAIMLAPVLAEVVQRGLPAGSPPSRLERIVLAAAVVVVGSVVLAATPARSAGPPLAPWLAQRLEEMPPGTRVLNDWDAGGYFLWKAPQVDLVMHGYADVFTPQELRRNVALVRVEAGWDDRVADLDADYALLEPDSALAYALTRHASWDVVDQDRDYVLLRAP